MTVDGLAGVRIQRHLQSLDLLIGQARLAQRVEQVRAVGVLRGVVDDGLGDVVATEIVVRAGEVGIAEIERIPANGASPSEALETPHRAVRLFASVPSAGDNVDAETTTPPPLFGPTDRTGNPRDWIAATPSPTRPGDFLPDPKRPPNCPVQGPFVCQGGRAPTLCRRRRV